MKMNGFTLPRWLWAPELGCTVEILRTGHFPTTVMAKTPDDKELELEITSLEIPVALTRPKL